MAGKGSLRLSPWSGFVHICLSRDGRSRDACSRYLLINETLSLPETRPQQQILDIGRWRCSLHSEKHHAAGLRSNACKIPRDEPRRQRFRRILAYMIQIQHPSDQTTARLRDFISQGAFMMCSRTSNVSDTAYVAQMLHCNQTLSLFSPESRPATCILPSSHYRILHHAERQQHHAFLDEPGNLRAVPFWTLCFVLNVSSTGRWSAMCISYAFGRRMSAETRRVCHRKYAV